MSAEPRTAAATLSPYREAYRLRLIEEGRKRTDDCGDWLAEQLRDLRMGGTDWRGRDLTGFALDEFNAVLRENRVSFVGKWTELPSSGQKGWQGRYRMCARHKLEVLVLHRGYLLMKGEKRFAPKDWLKKIACRNPRVRPCWSKKT